MIAVAVLAPLLAVGIEIVRHNPLDEMYGPDGLLESRQRFYSEVSDGSSALQDGRYTEAERHFRSALKLFHSPSERHYMKDPVGEEATPSLGLADALAGQGRYREAEALYKRSLAAHRQEWGSDHREDPEEDKILDHHAATLRRMGRMTEANELATCTREIRERSGQEAEK
jgi:tetratricopeptide (TPR) repeat protein